MPKLLNPMPAPKKHALELRDRARRHFIDNPAVRALTFDQVRAAVPQLAGLTDAELLELAAEAGLEVELDAPQKAPAPATK